MWERASAAHAATLALLLLQIALIELAIVPLRPKIIEIQGMVH
jgi:hypothetical protein